MLILHSIIICFYDNFSFAQKYIKQKGKYNMILNQRTSSSKQKKWIIVGVIALIVVVAAISIFVMQ
ncbi:hypothetical protein CN693_29780, partial [Bacillus pseudomycoides]